MQKITITFPARSGKHIRLEYNLDSLASDLIEDLEGYLQLAEEDTLILSKTIDFGSLIKPTQTLSSQGVVSSTTLFAFEKVTPIQLIFETMDAKMIKDVDPWLTLGDIKYEMLVKLGLNAKASYNFVRFAGTMRPSPQYLTDDTTFANFYKREVVRVV